VNDKNLVASKQVCVKPFRRLYAVKSTVYRVTARPIMLYCYRPLGLSFLWPISFCVQKSRV